MDHFKIKKERKEKNIRAKEIASSVLNTRMERRRKFLENYFLEMLP